MVLGGLLAAFSLISVAPSALANDKKSVSSKLAETGATTFFDDEDDYNDIEGDNECDGCEDEPSVAAPLPAMPSQPGSSASTDEEAVDPRVELEGVYTMYLMMSSCNKYGVFITDEDVELTKNYVTKIQEKYPDKELQDLAWKNVEPTGTLMDMGMAKSYTRAQELCSYAQLFGMPHIREELGVESKRPF